MTRRYNKESPSHGDLGHPTLKGDKEYHIVTTKSARRRVCWQPENSGFYYMGFTTCFAADFRAGGFHSKFTDANSSHHIGGPEAIQQTWPLPPKLSLGPKRFSCWRHQPLHFERCCGSFKYKPGQDLAPQRLPKSLLKMKIFIDVCETISQRC